MSDPLDAMTIADAAQSARVPAGTIRRWLSEGRLCRYGDHKPWRVSLTEVGYLRDTLEERQRATRFERSS